MGRQDSGLNQSMSIQDCVIERKVKRAAIVSRSTTAEMERKRRERERESVCVCVCWLHVSRFNDSKTHK